MGDLLLWWVAAEAVGLAALPITFAFFRRLPDRGFAFSKVIGLLLLGYGLWIGAVVGLFPNSRGSVILLLLLMAGVSIALAGRYRDELTGFLRTGWRYIAFVEVMFFAVLASAVFIRSFAPEIIWGEKPFELAFLNSINRSEFFPPDDPWLAGHSISYYYFGYVMIAALTKLTALSTSVTFYLALSLTAALAAVTAFGLVYNMVAASRSRTQPVPAEGPPFIPRGVVFGLAGAGLMLIVSNLAGVFELMARHGIGSAGFFGKVGIFDLNGTYDCAAAPGDCSEWYPTRFWWWWKATRMGSPFDIQEFPFFSLQFGDLHPHVLVMPFTLTLLAVALHWFVGARSGSAAAGGEGEERLDLLWGLRHPGRFLLVALLLGGIAFTDAWALPLAGLMVVAAATVVNWLRSGYEPLRAILDTFGFAVPMLAAMFIFYLPFYLNLDADTRGLDITQAAETGFPPAKSESTWPLHFLLFWSPLLWLVLSFIGVYVWTRWRQALTRSTALLAVLAWAVPVGIYAFVVLVGGGIGALADEVSERGPNLITLAILATAITAVALAFLHQIRGPAREQDRSQLFSFYLAGFAFLMLLGAEFFFVKDLFNWRVNTTFRFWHQSWLILAIVGAFGLYRLTLGWRLPRLRPGEIPWPRLAMVGVAFGAAYTVLVAVEPWDVLFARWWTATLGLFVGGAAIVAYAGAAALRQASGPAAWQRLSWLGVTVVILSAALVYPVTVTLERTGGFRNPQSLNGLVHVQRGDLAEFEAIEWLNENVEGQPVILEAVGDDFSDFGRVSARTGLPTVMGWPGHELQWRGYPSAYTVGPTVETPFTARPDEVAAIYTTTNIAEAEALLQKYGVEYVFVGRLEAEKYGDGGFAKFRDLMLPVFENGGVTIYRMPVQTAAVSSVDEGDGQGAVEAAAAPESLIR